MSKKALFILTFFTLHGFAQVQLPTKDSIVLVVEPDLTVLKQPSALKFNVKQLIIPAGLIAYGAFGTSNGTLKAFDQHIYDELNKSYDRKKSIDDYSRYAPVIAVYGLNLAGVYGKHRFVDRTIIFATSSIIMGTVVMGLKKTVSVTRPDGSTNTSFPSGHTATAFAGAEMLYQEYKDESVLYGIAGYVVASGTGFFRVYNNKHWVTDVAAGAGIGIVSTKIAYWIHPFIKKTLFKNESPKTTSMVLPFYNGKEMGVGFARTF